MDKYTITLTQNEIDIVKECLETYMSYASHENLFYSYDEVNLVFKIFRDRL